MIGDKQEGEEPSTEKKQTVTIDQQHQCSGHRYAAGADLHRAIPPQGGLPPRQRGLAVHRGNERIKRPKTRRGESAAKERFVNMTQEEVMNMNPVEMKS